jgi:murein DD-endopeptidase MepM/ murein hydrolase activator NlpD
VRSRFLAVVTAAVLVAAPAAAQSEPPPTDESSTTTTTVDGSTTTSTTGSTSTTVVGSSTTSTTVDPSSTTTSTTVDPSSTTSTTEGPEPEVPPAVPGALTPEQVSAIDALRNEYEDVAADELGFFERLLASQALIDNLNTEIANLDLSLTTVEADLRGATERVTRAERRLAELETQLTQASDELADAQSVLREWAVQAYVAGGPTAQTAAVLGAADASEYQVTVAYASALAKDQQEAIDEVVRLRERTRALAADARQQRNEAVVARDLVSLRQGDLAVQRGQQVQARTVVEKTVAEQQALLLETAERRAEYERRLADMSGVSDGISGALANAQAGQPDALLTTGIFLPPIKGGRVVSLFGPRVHPIYGVSRMHNGIDIDAAAGTPIRAAGDGVVLMAEVRGGYGNCVVVDHGNGIGTLHAHMSVFAVLPGQVVRQGDVLGAVGSTGLSTGPHLHWEVRLRGQPVNPLPYLGADR